MFKGAAVVMGVASCGKTTVGEALAKALNVPFIEGDRLHPPANIAKMSAGIALTDQDRWPWLAKVGEGLQGSEGAMASCSALRRVYREKIEKAAGRPVSFIYLRGSKALLEARIAARRGHFMPASLLSSQLATLETPGADERAVTIDIALPLEEIVARAVAYLTAADRR